MAGWVFSRASKMLLQVSYAYHSNGCCSHILHKCKIARSCLGVCLLCGTLESALCCVWGQMSVIPQ